MERLYQGQQQVPPIQPFALFPESPSITLLWRHMLSLDLKDETPKDTHASSVPSTKLAPPLQGPDNGAKSPHVSFPTCWWPCVPTENYA